MGKKTPKFQIQSLGNLTGLIITFSFSILVIRITWDKKRPCEKQTFKRQIIWMTKTNWRNHSNSGQCLPMTEEKVIIVIKYNAWTHDSDFFVLGGSYRAL